MPPDLTSLRRTLSSIIGAEHVASGDAAAAYAIDGIAPTLVARPGSQDEVAHVVAACGAAGAVLSCWGGGTSIGLGNPPARLDVVVRLDRLDRIVEYDGANLNVSVEAGVRLGALAELLAANGQFLPVDPPLADAATVGGLVCANANGPSRLRHGPVRDWVLGLRAVLTDGARIRCGGKVIKNVTGYDMNKLLIGSLGTLAVVTEATFKLLPLPVARATVVGRFAELSQVEAAVTRTLASFLLPDALDVLDRGAMEAAALPLAAADPSHHTLFAAVSGSEETVARQVRDLVQLFTEAGAAGVVPLGAEEAERTWRALRDARAGVGGPGAARVVAKVAVPIARTLEVFASAERLARRLGGPSAIAAHAGSGVVHAAFVAEDGRAAALADGLSALRGEAERAEGSLVLEAAPVALKRSLEAWGNPRQPLSLLRRLKHEFDPGGVLSPGRFVGGI